MILTHKLIISNIVIKSVTFENHFTKLFIYDNYFSSWILNSEP